jgi:hypothetical protein
MEGLRLRVGRWIVPVLAGVSAAAWASGGDLHFERVGTESGPPPEVITSVYQDRAGFIWIGSRDGLTLYDGYSFTGFEHDPSEATSISDNTIRTIYEDSKGNLWLGTNTGGLNRLDRATWTFEHFRHDSADPTSISPHRRAVGRNAARPQPLRPRNRRVRALLVRSRRSREPEQRLHLRPPRGPGRGAVDQHRRRRAELP